MPIGQPYHAVAQREARTGLGVGMMALAVLFFTCIDTSAKWLVTAGLASIQVAFVRYAVHFALALVVFLPREGRDAIRSNAPGRQFLRSMFLMGSTACNFAALQYLPITVTTTIMFAGPIVVTLLSIPILGERVGIHRIAAVLIGFGDAAMGHRVSPRHAAQPCGADHGLALFRDDAAAGRDREQRHQPALGGGAGDAMPDAIRAQGLAMAGSGN
jgi:threonine/homoserine efflux transporter RhtA